MKFKMNCTICRTLIKICPEVPPFHLLLYFICSVFGFHYDKGMTKDYKDACLSLIYCGELTDYKEYIQIYGEM